MNTRKLIAKSLVLSLAFFALPTMAQTPDGETPVNEGICDELMADGVSPGLYGLCVAFCEAQNHADVLAPITEAELESLADTAPAGRILENYNKKKAETDPPMPCIVVEEPCPCWTATELAEIDGIMWDGTVSYSTLPVEPNGKRCFDFSGPNFTNTFLFEVTRIDVIYAEKATLAQSYGYDVGTQNRCEFYRLRNGPNGSTTRTYLDITVEERLACRASLQNYQANSGYCERIDP